MCFPLRTMYRPYHVQEMEPTTDSAGSDEILSRVTFTSLYWFPFPFPSTSPIYALPYARNVHVKHRWALAPTLRPRERNLPQKFENNGARSSATWPTVLKTHTDHVPVPEIL